MKKVKITVTPGSIGRILPVFATSGDAYVWLMEANKNPNIINELMVDQVVLTPEKFIEAEWLGCEFAYEGQTHVRIDNVRLAMAAHGSSEPTTHSGWTVYCIIPFRAYKDDDITVADITEGESVLDMGQFNDDAEQK